MSEQLTYKQKWNFDQQLNFVNSSCQGLESDPNVMKTLVGGEMAGKPWNSGMIHTDSHRSAHHILTGIVATFSKYIFHWKIFITKL